MTATRDEITINIGNLIGQAANNSSSDWDYAGFMFDAASKGGEPFLYSNGRRLSLEIRTVRKELRINFLRLREITRVDGDDYWIRCLAVVKNDGKQFKMLFEFDDKSRWEITPTNARDSYRILVGEIFPEALE